MNKKGFTLTEIMIVLIIISGLMYLIVPNLSSTKANLDEQTCYAYIELVNTQIQAYIIDHEGAPADLDTLVSGKYIKSSTCPNGTTITYEDGIASIVEVTTTS